MCSCFSIAATIFLFSLTVAILPAVIISVWFGICLLVDVAFEPKLTVLTHSYCAICLLAPFVGIGSILALNIGFCPRNLLIHMHPLLVRNSLQIHWNFSIYQSFDDHHYQRWMVEIRILMRNVWIQLYIEIQTNTRSHPRTHTQISFFDYLINVRVYSIFYVEMMQKKYKTILYSVENS